ncbi:hypothetical protein K1T71_009203 [Dendrolimus kikuchii]|uniref:Uncharacterized protein n=1 Tax=Dendrolimus kikuchii TaxID=765133 RepID=A0ACC1CUX7_9NEOP|nr:hypothetical protein K1T71_009203 [Dendrolimus kikuchii]
MKYLLVLIAMARTISLCLSFSQERIISSHDPRLLSGYNEKLQSSMRMIRQVPPQLPIPDMMPPEMPNMWVKQGIRNKREAKGIGGTILTRKG